MIDVLRVEGRVVDGCSVWYVVDSIVVVYVLIVIVLFIVCCVYCV